MFSEAVLCIVVLVRNILEIFQHYNMLLYYQQLLINCIYDIVYPLSMDVLGNCYSLQTTVVLAIISLLLEKNTCIG